MGAPLFNCDGSMRVFLYAVITFWFVLVAVSAVDLHAAAKVIGLVHPV